MIRPAAGMRFEKFFRANEKAARQLGDLFFKGE
jgi:hypothetical protein